MSREEATKFVRELEKAVNSHDTRRLLEFYAEEAVMVSPVFKGIMGRAAIAKSWDTVFSTNLKGPFFLAQLAARQMIALIDAAKIPRATIINVSSISAYAISTNRADYCMAKAAMQTMTWLFADRLAEHQINVYEVCPGVIASDMTAPVKEKYDQLIADGLSPIRRWGQPEDVASAVAMLAAGQLPFSTGERINIDGGFHIRRL